MVYFDRVLSYIYGCEVLQWTRARVFSGFITPALPFTVGFELGGGVCLGKVSVVFGG